MRLEKWLEMTGTKRVVFVWCFCVLLPTITRIIAGTQNIPLSIQDAIKRETDGAVTPDDLHEAWLAQKAGAA